MDAERCMQIGIPVFNNLLILTRRAFYLQILHSFSALALMFKSPPFPHIPRERMRRKRSLAKSLRSLASSSSPRAESSELWSRVGKLLRPLALRKRRTHAQRRGNQFSPRLPPFPHGIILFCVHSNGKKRQQLDELGESSSCSWTCASASRGCVVRLGVENTVHTG